MWRGAVAMFRREALGASRRRGALAGVLMLALTLLVVGQAAFSPTPEETASLLPGLVWMAGLLASGAGLARLWDAEGEVALRDALLASPADRAGLGVGKALWGAVV
ncbi:heme exporter protein CcmB, partial [bacterium]|nr:heme exporter protein CcmB [bacterium]